MPQFNTYEESTAPNNTDILLILEDPSGSPKIVKVQVANLAALRGLSNLSGTAVNADIDPGTDNNIDLGNSAKTFKDVYLNQLLLKERSAPSTPSSGLMGLYVSASGILHFLNDGGTDFSLGIYPDLLISARGINPRSDNGCGALETYETSTNKVMFDGLPFDKDSDEFAQLQIPLPRDYDGGAWQFKFYWYCKTGIGGASKTVEWAIQGLSFGDNESMDASWGTAKSVNDTWQSDEKVHISDWTDSLTLAGTPGPGELSKFQVYRDVSEDDLAGDAYLLAVLGKFTRT